MYSYSFFNIEQIIQWISNIVCIKCPCQIAIQSSQLNQNNSEYIWNNRSFARVTLDIIKNKTTNGIPNLNSYPLSSMVSSYTNDNL